MKSPNLKLLLTTGILAIAFSGSNAQYPFRQVRPPQIQPAPAPQQIQVRRASELISRQEPLKINQKLFAQVAADDVHVVVSIPKQRAYLLSGDQVVIDSPISSGKRGHSTPTGHFSVLEKEKDHHSTLYGDFCDSSGRVVRSGVSMHIDSAPSGTHFVGAKMTWFMRLTSDGVGMHIGILPGYPASHGCVRMPSQGAELFYSKVKVGTPVDVNG